MALINYNPVLTTVAAGTFNTQSQGYIQGTALNDPVVRYQLSGGYLGLSETLPMWGGVGVGIQIPGAASTPDKTYGPAIVRATGLTATSATGLAGFSVFDQANAMVNFAGSEVPLAASGMTVSFYELGSLARIAVAVDPALVSLAGGAIGQQVSWDFTAQRLVKYTPTYAANTITGAVWASTSGGQTTFTVSSDPTAYATAGVTIDVTGVVNTGGTSTSAFNGSFIVVSSTSTTIVVTQAASVSPGTYASGGSVVAGGGALPVKVLDVAAGNSMTVSYNSATGLANWTRSGSCAIIQI